MSYPAVPQSATQARHDVGLILSAWSLEPLRDTAELVMTELVANAVRHAEGRIEVTVLRMDSGVEIAVSDTCVTYPHLREATPADESGRGLLLVEAFASAWGTDRLQGGKRVWAQLDL